MVLREEDWEIPFVYETALSRVIVSFPEAMAQLLDLGFKFLRL